MNGEYCSPYPHLSWLAHWLGVHPPRMVDLHARRHVGHHLLLTTSGDADIRWQTCGVTTTCHAVVGSLSFFPCDDDMHDMSITSANGFLAYEISIPDRHLRMACDAEGVRPMHEFRAAGSFRDALLESSLLRLSTRPDGRQVSEDIGDDIAARQIVLRLCALRGGRAPDWQKDGSVFTPAVMRQLVACIDAHLGVPLSLESMAESVRLSPGHFARKFQHSAGLSLNRFMNVRRVATAFTLLRTEASALSSIALDLGFSSQSHFTKLFSRLSGMSPMQFRKLHRRMNV